MAQAGARSAEPLVPHDAGASGSNGISRDHHPCPYPFFHLDPFLHDEFVGRKEEHEFLDRALQGGASGRVIGFRAAGGQGKTNLVAHWARKRIRADKRTGLKWWYFEWSFHLVDDPEAFVRSAHRFFGGADMGDRPPQQQDACDVARRAGEVPSLIVLDGIDRYQNPNNGQLNNNLLTSFLDSFDPQERGLCVVTTRYETLSLDATTSIKCEELKPLSPAEGVELLNRLGVKGTPQELERLATDVRGDALALRLIGVHISDCHAGRIVRQHHASLFEATERAKNKEHPYPALRLYEDLLLKDKCYEQLAVLRLLSLFDRSATPDCIRVLTEADPLHAANHGVALGESDTWDYAIKKLVELRVVDSQPWEPQVVAGYDKATAERAMADPTSPLPDPVRHNAPCSGGVTLNCNAHLREYFADQLKKGHPELWTRAHGLLFDHLCSSDAGPYWPEGLSGLAPLYQAVYHGCQAGRERETWKPVVMQRISRGNAEYSHRIGGLARNLAGLTCFFEDPYLKPSRRLRPLEEYPLLIATAYCLGALGDFEEAGKVRNLLKRYTRWHIPLWWLPPLSCDYHFRDSQLELILGDLASAESDAAKSVRSADLAFRMSLVFYHVSLISWYLSLIVWWTNVRRWGAKARSWGANARSWGANAKSRSRAHLACVLYQRGDERAEGLFQEAEELNGKSQPKRRFLYGARGIRYCDYLLTGPERFAWKAFLGLRVEPEIVQGCTATLDSVAQRVEEVIQWVDRNELLTLALYRLMRARIWLYRQVIGPGSELRCSARDARMACVPQSARPEMAKVGREISDVVTSLNDDRTQEFIINALITQAWYYALVNEQPRVGAALNTAEYLATRGKEHARLLEVDVLLSRIRLTMLGHDPAVDKSVDDARERIERMGYKRRSDELDDIQKYLRTHRNC